MGQSDYDGRTALHLATCENHIEVVKFLLNVEKSKEILKTDGVIHRLMKRLD